jgi:exopolyphosphatase/guanosine-5'-triphosphate,3'-diphosphate pyrophosphatase
VIDIGSNSIRLAVAQRQGTRDYKLVYEQRAATRLAKDLDQTGHLDDGAVRKSVEAITAMVHAARGHGAEVVRAVATSAVREASDAWVFVDAVKASCGVEVEIITGHEEGRLAFVGASRAFDLHKGTSAVLDVGGGSSELVLAESGKLRRIISWPIGAVRLTDRFGGPALAPTEGFGAMKKFLDKLLMRGLRRVEVGSGVRTLVATGGTLSSLGLMQVVSAARAKDEKTASGSGTGEGTALKIETHDRAAVQRAVQGVELSRKQIKRLVKDLRKMTPSERARVPGLSRDRSEIIVAGALTVHRVMKALRTKRVLVHCGSIRDGVLAEMFEKTAT